MTKTTLSLILICLFIAFSPKAKGSTDYQEPLQKIKTLYASPIRFDDDLFAEESSRFDELRAHLEKMPPEMVVKSIDFESPFEAFYLLGYCFSIQPTYRKPVTSETRAKYYAAFFDRCAKDSSFRNGMVRYLIWTKNLFTEFKREGDMRMGLSRFKTYIEKPLKKDDADSSKTAFFCLVYMEVFGLKFENTTISFDEESSNNFGTLTKLRQELIELVDTSFFEVHYGHLYRPTKNSASSRMIRIEGVKDPKNYAQRIPNSVAPLFPTKKFSIELMNFLDLHEINREFCWSL